MPFGQTERHRSVLRARGSKSRLQGWLKTREELRGVVLTRPGSVSWATGGTGPPVDRAAALCKAAGAKRAVRLPVSAPFHCALMAPAQARLEADLARLEFRDPEFPVVTNVDAQLERTGAGCRAALVRQVSAPVRWLESVERLLAEGVLDFVEVGPRGVLGGLIRKVAKQARAWSVEDPESLERAVAALSAGAEVER